MEVTVIKESVIYNGKIYKEGDCFTADDSVAKSLAERGYVAEVGAAEPNQEATVFEAEMVNEEIRLEDMSYSELKRVAAQKGISAKGSKSELIARIAQNNVADFEDGISGEATSDDLPNTSMPE